MEITRYNLFIDSSQRSNGTNTNFNITLPHPIVLNDLSHYFQVKVENVCIPFSFKVVNSSNNTMSVSSTGAIATTFIMTLPEGNYNINNLISTVKALLNANFSNTCNITYDSSTSKATFSTTSISTITLQKCFITRLFGCSDNIVFSNVTPHLSDYHVNVNPIKCLFLRSENLKQPLGSFEMIVDTSYSDILARIPVDKINTYINYDDSRILVRISDQIISSINIYLTTDQDYNDLNLYGCTWQCTIAIIEKASEIHDSINKVQGPTNSIQLTQPSNKNVNNAPNMPNVPSISNVTSEEEKNNLLRQLEEYTTMLQNLQIAQDGTNNPEIVYSSALDGEPPPYNKGSVDDYENILENLQKAQEDLNKIKN